MTTPAALPSPPPLGADTMMDVFGHFIVSQDGFEGNGVKLANVGGKILDAVYMSIIDKKNPSMTANEIQTMFDDGLPALVERCVNGYDWKVKVVCPQDVDLNDPNLTRTLMNAYVGAVHVNRGFGTIFAWITALVDLEADAAAQQVQHAQPDQSAGHPPGYYAYAANTAVPPPAFTSNPAPDPTDKWNTAYLPMFNQLAAQKRLDVKYPGQFTGLPHAGIWTVECVVNGVSMGRGEGYNKQLAKEEAAKQAYHSMGWAPRT